MACQCRIDAGERQAIGQAAFLEISHSDGRGGNSSDGSASGNSTPLLTMFSLRDFFL